MPYFRCLSAWFLLYVYLGIIILIGRTKTFISTTVCQIQQLPADTITPPSIRVVTEPQWTDAATSVVALSVTWNTQTLINIHVLGGNDVSNIIKVTVKSQSIGHVTLTPVSGALVLINAFVAHEIGEISGSSDAGAIHLHSVNNFVLWIFDLSALSRLTFHALRPCSAEFVEFI